MDQPIIQVESLSKAFKLPHEKHTSIKSAVIGFYRRKKTFEQQQVLKGVNFSVQPGEFFGIVGRNGSGKSTLLKLLANIYTPTSGKVHIRGKLTPFIELGVGFNPELTGRENVFLNGALLGFTRKEVAGMYDSIVEFAELERFMDQKLKNYSSGMQVRLAFSIAIRADSDILLIDEVLAVGDAAFQMKCFNHFKELKKRRKTVVFISHDMNAIQDFCDRAILIDNGKIVTEGSPGKVAAEYNELNFERSVRADKGQAEFAAQVAKDKIAFVAKAWTSLNGKKTTVFKPEQQIEVNLDAKANRAVERPVTGIIVKDLTGKPVFVTNTKVEQVVTGSYKRGDVFRTVISFKNLFNDGSYTVTPAVASEDTHEVYDSIDDAIQFEVRGWDYPAGLVHPDRSVTVKKVK